MKERNADEFGVPRPLFLSAILQPFWGIVLQFTTLSRALFG
jgi:hypothetical protein